MDCPGILGMSLPKVRNGILEGIPEPHEPILHMAWRLMSEVNLSLFVQSSQLLLCPESEGCRLREGLVNTSWVHVVQLSFRQVVRHYLWCVEQRSKIACPRPSSFHELPQVPPKGVCAK